MPGYENDGSYWGITSPGGNTSTWVRTPSAGILPFKPSSNSQVGAVGWLFKAIYATSHYGNWTGNPIPIVAGGTGTTSAVAARTALGMKKLLWSGTWKSGNITVPGTLDYSVFAANISGTAMMIVGYKNTYSVALYGLDGDSNFCNSFFFQAGISGEKWSMLDCYYIHASAPGSNGAPQPAAIRNIYGIV